MKDNWYDFERLSGKKYIPPSESVIEASYTKFPWSNPKNAYMWGFVHGMLIMCIMLSVLLVIMI